MDRQAKTLQNKAKKNKVQPQGKGEFSVTSATSGKTYTVTNLANGGFQCTCKWSQYHRTDLKPCSHCLAVEEWLEQAGNRSLSFWTSEEEAQRQHRPVMRVGQGLWATSRAAA